MCVRITIFIAWSSFSLLNLRNRACNRGKGIAQDVGCLLACLSVAPLSCHVCGVETSLKSEEAPNRNANGVDGAIPRALRAILAPLGVG